MWSVNRGCQPGSGSIIKNVYAVLYLNVSQLLSRFTRMHKKVNCCLDCEHKIEGYAAGLHHQMRTRQVESMAMSRTAHYYIK